MADIPMDVKNRRKTTPAQYLGIISPLVAIALFFLLNFIITPARAEDSRIEEAIIKLELRSIDLDKRITLQEQLAQSTKDILSELKEGQKQLLNMHLRTGASR